MLHSAARSLPLLVPFSSCLPATTSHACLTTVTCMSLLNLEKGSLAKQAKYSFIASGG